MLITGPIISTRSVQRLGQVHALVEIHQQYAPLPQHVQRIITGQINSARAAFQGPVWIPREVVLSLQNRRCNTGNLDVTDEPSNLVTYWIPQTV
ncbi:hypothetical protein J6590_062693 [Homalodisca vitripennis]|nr:hypothetical protein J6590_062693 [Homalodisca vitripennis]